MALTDDRSPMFPPDPGPEDPGPRSGEFDRKPPQDIPAEQSVLGGMLLSKDAIADVVEALRPGDFYLPKHQAVYDCVLDLYGRGEPADPITVSAELERRGELARVGGAPYLHTLIATVPTAANAGYYGESVAGKAILRRRVEAGTRIVQFGYGAANEGGEINEVVDRAQAAIYEVTERRTSEDYVALEELLQPTMDEIDAIASRGGSAQGVPTGFADLDEATNGLHPGQMIIVAARPGVGKALSLDTPLPTPAGWTTMGEIAAGQELLGADGRPTRVVATTAVMRGRPCYEVAFSDGSTIVADAKHQWRVDSVVRTTEELAGLLGRNATPRPAVPTSPPVEQAERRLPLHPYALGAWLGSPSGFDFSTLEPEIVCRLEGEAGLAAEADAQAFQDCPGVADEPRIPAGYLRASAGQRRALLAGILDTSGSVTVTGAIEFPASGNLATDLHELITALGHVCTRIPDGATETLSFATEDNVFQLSRKNLEHKRQRASTEHPVPVRHIVAVRPVPSVPVRRVEGAAAERRSPAAPSTTPSPASAVGLDLARSCSVKHGMTSVIFSLEMSRIEIVMRMLSAEARIRLADMRGGRMSDDDWTRLARRMSEISEAPLFIDDSPNMTMMEIRAKARRLKQRNDLKLVVVDYMQLMTSGKRVESRQQEVSEFSRQLKLLAKELEVPVVAISQLNRGPEQRTDKRPMLSDLRESGSLEQDADIVLLINRPDAWERDDPRAGEADLILAKHRAGPTSTVVVAHQLHYSRFADLAQG